MRSITFVRKACIYLSVIALFSVLASCTKNAPDQPTSETYLYTAHSSDWVYTTNDTWEYYVYVPGIDSYILDNKAILIYYQDLNQNSTETLMPFTLNGYDYTYVTGIDNNGDGYLKVDVTAADATYDPSYYSPVGFKVVIIPN